MNKNSNKKILLIIFLLIYLFFIIFNNYVYADDNSQDLELDATSALLIDNKTNKILYKKDENKKMFPASTTKILTAILVLENCDLNDVVTASYDAVTSIPSGYSTANIQVGEQLTVEQLIELLLVHSANDAANILAEHTGGSIYSFITMMNTKVNELGLNDSHFTNAYGMQDDNHYTTAHDLAIIMQYCMKNDTFRKIAGQASCAIPATNLSGPRKYSSTNELLIAGSSNYYKNLIAGKTGYTSQAGGCLVSVAYHDDLELIGVILNSDNRFGDTRLLYDYGFSNFLIKNIVNEKDIVTNIKIKNGTKQTKNLDLLVSESIPVLTNNDDNLSKIEPTINIPNDINAPIEEGQKIGKVSYSVNGITYTSDLIASHSVEKTKMPQYISITCIAFIILLICYNKAKRKQNKKIKRK